MNILFATSFKNEQTANGVPKRVTTVNNGANLSSPLSVGSNGYDVAIYNTAGQTPNWYIQVPVVTTKRYVCYSVKLTARKAGQDAVGTAWQWARLNMFGYEVLRGELWPGYFVTDGEQFRLSVIQDMQTGTSKAFVNRRYVGIGTVSNTWRWEPSDPALSKTTGTYISDLAVGESDTEEGAMVTLTDTAFAEGEIQWSYTGASFTQSVDKTNTTVTTPNAVSYKDSNTFTIAPAVTDSPLLVEFAGSGPGDYVLVAEMDTEELSAALPATQGAGQFISKPTTSIKIGRTIPELTQNILAWPNFMYLDVPGDLSDPVLHGLDNYGYQWSRVADQTQVTTAPVYLHFDATTSLYCDSATTTKRGIIKAMPRGLFSQNWFFQLWFFPNASVDNQSSTLFQMASVTATLTKTSGVSYARLNGPGFSSNIANGWTYLCGNYRASDNKFWWYLNGTKLATVKVTAPELTDGIPLVLGSTVSAYGVNIGISEFRFERNAGYDESVITIPVPTGPLRPR